MLQAESLLDGAEVREIGVAVFGLVTDSSKWRLKEMANAFILRRKLGFCRIFD